LETETEILSRLPEALQVKWQQWDRSSRIRIGRHSLDELKIHRKIGQEASLREALSILIVRLGICHDSAPNSKDTDAVFLEFKSTNCNIEGEVPAWAQMPDAAGI